MPEKFIPLSVPNLGEAERKAMEQCIASGWVSTASPQVNEFEQSMGAYTGASCTVALSSGSAALFLAMKALGLQAGDLILLPSLTFIATANAAVHKGATPVFIDCDPQSLHMDIRLAERFLSEECSPAENGTVHKETGKRVWGLVLVHTFGYVDNPLPWAALAKKHRLRWVEDAAAALGSFHEGKHAGLTADAGVLSFNGNKILTTGAGGMTLTSDEQLSRQILHLSTQGYAADRKGEYLHDLNGHNLRMPGLSAALGLAQLTRMKEFLDHKSRLHAFYVDAFRNVEEICPYRNPQPASSPNHWMFNCAVKNPEALIAHLSANKIEAKKIWVPLHQQPVFKDHYASVRNPQSENAYRTFVSLPCSTAITQEEANRVVESVKSFFTA